MVESQPRSKISRLILYSSLLCTSIRLVQICILAFVSLTPYGNLTGTRAGRPRDCVACAQWRRTQKQGLVRPLISLAQSEPINGT